MENTHHEVMANFRRQNRTVKEWAKDNGFYWGTVQAVIRGLRGSGGSRGPRAEKSEAIRQALIDDGFWPSDENTLSH